VFWWQSPVTTYLTGVLIGHWWLPSEHLSNMWSLVIAIRTPVKYVVNGDCHQNTCQICGHWWLPSEHLSNMFWWQWPVTTY
jgi:hypothetical protein